MDLPTINDLGSRVGLPTSRYLRKISHRCTQSLGFWLIPNIVKVTAKNLCEVLNELGPVKVPSLGVEIGVSLDLHLRFQPLLP